jgi:hypothetical protein
MPDNIGGFGTRIYFIPNSAMDPKNAQILKGSGYTTINLKGTHYRSDGNLWQQIFGGSDKVTLSTQITHASAQSSVSSASIEETRLIDVGNPCAPRTPAFLATPALGGEASLRLWLASY